MKPNHFIHKMAKELIQTMPVDRFEGDVIVVDKTEQIPEAIDYLKQQQRLGIDTEARPSFTRGVHYPTALVQVATLDRCYLFRLTHVGMPQELADIFADNAICKVGLAFKDDINGLRRRRDFTPRNCIDIQSIARKYGILDLGLAKIYAICFGRKISKAQQLTNWENSHLTPEQQMYAATDAWATLRIYEELMATQQLPKKEAEALYRAELEKMQLHQQEVLAAREAKKNSESEAVK